MAKSISGLDERLRRTSPVRSIQMGDTTVTYVPDGAAQLTPRWLPDTTDEVWAAHPEYLDATGNMVASIGGLLVEHDGRSLLIDAGFGPCSLPAEAGRPLGAIHGGDLLDNLTALGRRPGDVEAVAITHLHTDHIGWAWQPVPGTDRLAFPDADYLVAEPEWSGRHLIKAHVSPKALDVLEPRVRTVGEGEEIFPGVHVMPTPGHTPGHTAYVIGSGGLRLIAFGDAMHSPIQVDHPAWSAAPDYDPKQSEDSRRHLIAEMAEPRTIGFGVHFADVIFGRVDPRADGPAWQPYRA
ncbi:MBL fold metallo-hydrolase [Streptosporangium subroseum]|uniref:MBL fold metallo-hydrolase n=1 Tax=Streptosporangium subroseum TaxID=106412 RepID=UPI003088BCC7|nr:MBL fold metallo-hydrolase [Streptosporangium subroseum]